MSAPSRHYCFTSFGIDPPLFDDKKHRYMVYQREECKETKKEHWQGYCELLKPMRLKGFKKSIGDEKAHCEIRKGSREQARDYCTKKDTRIDGPFFGGEWIESTEAGNAQGKRTDLDGAVKCKNIEEVKSKFPGCYVRFHRGFEKLLGPGKPRKDKPWVEWHWGPTGVGKSRYCHEYIEEADDNTYYTKPDGKWWDHYAQQRVVILDDFDKEWIPFGQLLKLLDRYPHIVEFKGGSCHFNSEIILITSHFSPDHFCPPDREDELFRRIDVIKEWKKIEENKPAENAAKVEVPVLPKIDDKGVNLMEVCDEEIEEYLANLE